MTMSSDNTSNRVYILHPTHSWIPARVLSSADSTHSTVTAVNYKDDVTIPPCDGGHGLKRGETMERTEIDLTEYAGGVLPLQNVDENGKLNEVEDMVDLPFLHEAAILYNLKVRHGKGLPYTRTGDIVIAVNPYQWIDGLYSDQKRTLYADKLVLNANDDADPRALIVPHVYEASSLAYRGLAVDGQPQSILVSGESGAGKTETVKILMSHLASVQSKGLINNHYVVEESDDEVNTNAPPVERKASSSFRTSPIVERVLDSNPLLEAFGNAKTVRNDNSSRFGKYIQLQFDAEDPTLAAFAGKVIPRAILAGSKCEVYLLEKSRVVSHEEEERTYHIFYQLLAAPDEVKAEIWEGLVGTDNESFDYVGYTDTHTIEDKTDGQRWQYTVDALDIIGVKGERLMMLMRAVCIVLQLGNLEFDDDPDNDENSIISSKEELEKLAKLMGVEEKEVEAALTERTVKARNEVYKVPLNAVKAKDSCDAFAKEIYHNVFLWLVRTINLATTAELNYDEVPSGEEFGLIGLLDIFGFESFQVNRFEQLCINYANEKLQQKFTLDIFRSVQSEYEFEGIELGEVEFSDNSDVLNLIEGRMGLISVLNEECVRPKGNDTSFVAKVYTMNKDSDCLFKDRFFRDFEFGVNHYAGPVVYDSNNFVTKNMDTLPSDLVDCGKMSTNDLVSQEFEADFPDETPKKPSGRKGSKMPQSRVPPIVRKGGSTLVAQTVWTKFRTQLTDLMSNIGQTRTRYIRCIKPNTLKKPRIMQHMTTVEQLRCAGVVAAVTISRSAFPNRLEHENVLDRFSSLGNHFVRETIPGDDNDAVREDVNKLLSHALVKLEVQKGERLIKGFVCGRTRTYFRSGALEYLESERLKSFAVHAVEMQRIARGYMQRSKYTTLRIATVKVQSKARSSAMRRRYKEILAACVLAQCWARCVSAKISLSQFRKNYSATKIQNHWRMVVAVAILKKSLSATVKIQALVRGSRQRPIYRKALKEAIEEAKLENQLKALQKKLEEAEAKRLEAEKKAEEGARTVVVHKDAPVEATEEKKADSHHVGPVTETATGMMASSGHPMSHQQTLLDESQQVLEYLKKEVFRLRSRNAQLVADFELLKDNNQRLMDANASAGASFAALNQHAKQLNKTNNKLQAEVEKQKQQVTKLNLAQVELKEELKMKQGTYIAEVHSRLQYQKTLQGIVDMIQDRCRDYRLVEDVLSMNDNCESDFMGDSTGVDPDSAPREAMHSHQSRSPSYSERGGGTSAQYDSSLSSRFKSFFG